MDLGAQRGGVSVKPVVRLSARTVRIRVSAGVFWKFLGLLGRREDGTAAW